MSSRGMRAGQISPESHAGDSALGSTGGANKPIESYALIGDCRSAALVGLDGSIDWLCWPRFDSESIFAAILDSDHGGHFSVAPTDVSETTRCYRANSNILTTSFRTPSGVVELTDLFYAGGSGAAGPSLHPASMLIRRLRGVDGEVQMRLSYKPRPGYGARTAKFIRAGPRS